MIREKKGEIATTVTRVRSFQASQAQPFKLFPRSGEITIVYFLLRFFASSCQRYPTSTGTALPVICFFPFWFAWLLSAVVPTTLLLSWKFNRGAATSPLMRFFAAFLLLPCLVLPKFYFMPSTSADARLSKRAIRVRCG